MTTMPINMYTQRFQISVWICTKSKIIHYYLNWLHKPTIWFVHNQKLKELDMEKKKKKVNTMSWVSNPNSTTNSCCLLESKWKSFAHGGDWLGIFHKYFMLSLLFFISLSMPVKSNFFIDNSELNQIINSSKPQSQAQKTFPKTLFF